jgi:hypothetical protein
MTSLEGWSSAIELHPRVPVDRDVDSLAGRDTLGLVAVCCGGLVRGVAQFGSALALGARGRRFKSGHPDLGALTSGNAGQGPLVDAVGPGGSAASSFFGLLGCGEVSARFMALRSCLVVLPARRRVLVLAGRVLGIG